MVASTVEKRLSVLEAKDKAEHERRHTVPGYPVLSSNLSEKQTVTVGTCPDMCPESVILILPIIRFSCAFIY